MSLYKRFPCSRPCCNFIPKAWALGGEVLVKRGCVIERKRHLPMQNYPRLTFYDHNCKYLITNWVLLALNRRTRPI